MSGLNLTNTLFVLERLLMVDLRRSLMPLMFLDKLLGFVKKVESSLIWEKMPAAAAIVYFSWDSNRLFSLAASLLAWSRMYCMELR